MYAMGTIKPNTWLFLLKTRLFTYEGCFVACAVIFGVIFILITPIFWGVDEGTHYARAYQISEGHITAESLGHAPGKGFGGYIPKNVADAIGLAGQDIVDPPSSSLGTGEVDNRGAYAKIGSQRPSKEKVVFTFSNTAAYSPVAYIPSAIALKAATIVRMNITDSILLARLFDLIAYTVIVALALRSLAGNPYRRIVFVIALLPMALYQASIINADAVTNALAIAISALLVKALFYKQTLSKTELSMLIVITLLLPLLKPTYILLVPIAFLFKWRQDSSSVKDRQIKFITVAVCLLLFAVWTFLSKGTAAAAGLSRMDVWTQISIGRQAHFILSHPLGFVSVLAHSILLSDNGYLIQIIGWIGFNTVSVPAVSLVSSLSALMIALIASGRISVGKKRLLAIASLLAAGCLAVFGTLYLTYSRVRYPVVEGVQGRYFLPLLPLTAAVIAIVFRKLGISVDITKKSSFRISATLVTLVGVSLLFAATKYYFVTWG